MKSYKRINRIFFICLLQFVWIIALGAQDKTEVLKQRNFKGTALYGYMNGGSDLYYEYGFKELDVTELEFTFYNDEDSLVKEKYTVEVYKMESAPGAFGLYSVHVNKFLRRDIFGFDCLTKYQLQGCILDRYISIVFENPSASAAEGALRIYRQYLDSAANAVKFSIPQMIKERLLYSLQNGAQNTGVSGRIKFIKGMISLNNSAQDLYPVFDGFDEFGLWITEDTDERDKTVYNAVALFPSEEIREAFYNRNNGITVSGDFAPLKLERLSGNAVFITLGGI